MKHCLDAPALGDRRTGRQIGKNPCSVYIYAQCPVCKKERWVSRQRGKVLNRCKSCSNSSRNSYHSGELSFNWKGGRFTDGKGYIKVRCPDNHKGQKGGYICEHRLIWEQSHKRRLTENEVIHHLNGIRDDNRPVNLIVLPRANHTRKEMGEAYKKRIRQVELELKQLKMVLSTKQLIWEGGSK